MKHYFGFLLAFCFLFMAKSHAYNCQSNKNRAAFDVLHYDIALKFDTTNHEISGLVKIKATCLSNPKTHFQIDLQSPLVIKSIKYENQTLPFRKDNDKYLVQIPGLIAEETFDLSIEYSGKPAMALRAPWDGGLTVSKDPNGKIWMAMSCQGKGASMWFPCKDFNQDEPDMGVDLHYTIPERLVAVGNGKLLNVNATQAGFNTWHWRVLSPINLYNITFYIGDYIKHSETITSSSGDLPFEFYALNKHFEKARNQFKVVPEMIQIFEDWFGSYPFLTDGFKIVEAPYLGMEHQSAIAYGNKYQMGYDGKSRTGSNIDLQFDFILIHETAHEWFGNNISISDPAYFWIHEGFTTYAEALYVESKLGETAAKEYLIASKKLVKNEQPIQSKLGQCNNPNTDNYPKGALLIHNIRSILNNDSLFKSFLTKINTHFKHKIVTGPQVEFFMESSLNLNLKKTFDQYLRNANLPTLVISKTDQGFQYQWKNCVRNFDMPVPLMIDEKSVIVHPSTTTQLYKTKATSIKIAPDFYCDFELK